MFQELDPVKTILPLTGTGKGDTGLISREDARVKGIMDTWLTMFDEMLKTGKTLPVDLIGRAAEIAKGLRSAPKQT